VLKKGEIAPDFPVGDRSLYQILDGSAVVVFFFPKAFTPGCTKEAGGFRREYETLRKSGCEVVGVSSDSQQTNDRFQASLGLPYPLVGDPEGAISRAYKVRWPIIGVNQRVTYVVSRARKVRVAFHSELDMDAHVTRACETMASGAS